MRKLIIKLDACWFNVVLALGDWCHRRAASHLLRRHQRLYRTAVKQANHEMKRLYASFGKS